MTTPPSNSGRTTAKKRPPRPTGDNSDLLDLFAEAKAKAAERNGLRITIADRTLELWPSRFTYRERQQLWQHTGLTPNDAAMMLASGTGSIEAIAAVCAQAMFQQYDGVLPDMDGLVAWVEAELLQVERPDGYDRMVVDVLDFDEQVDGGDESPN